MALELLEDNDTSFKVKRDDGVVVPIAKTPDTMPIYKLCKGGAITMSKGGEVAGKAVEKGDSPKNDTVDAKLSPGEIVIPREVIAKGEQAVARFVREAMTGKHPAKGTKHYMGGEIEDVARQEGVGRRQPTPDDSPLTQWASGQIDSFGNSTAANPADVPTSPYLPYNPANGFAPTAADDAPGNSAPTDIAAPTPAEPGTNPPVAPASNASALLPNLTQTGTTRTTEIPTAAQTKSMNDLEAETKDYQKNLIDAGTAKAQLDLAQHTAEANLVNENNLKYKAFQEQRDKEVQDRLDKIKGVESKFDGMTIDGGRFFGDGITGSKVMAAIGLALGALGQGFTGKDYGVNDIINKAIDRDIEVQKANIAKAGKQVDLARGGLRDYLSVSNDMGTAITAEKARQLEAVGKQFEAIAAGNSSAAVKAAAQQQVLTIQEKVAGLRNQVGKSTVTQTVQTMPMKLDPVPEKVNEDVQKNIKASAALDRIRELKDVVGTGPVEGRINRLAAKFGLQGADTAELQQKLRENFISLVHDVGGARGFSDNERGFFENATLNDLMNSKVFDRLLDERQKEVEGTLNMHMESARQNGQRPINVEAQKRAYRDSSPQFSDQYFKPQGFKSGRK